MSHRVIGIAGFPRERLAAFDDSPDTLVLIDCRGPRRAVTLGLDELTKTIGRPLREVELDLLEIAAVIFSSDQCVLRGPNEAWVRDMWYHFPVRDAERWREVQGLLLSLVHLATWDRIHVELVPAEDPVPPPALPKGARPAEVDCVCLLSGGLDSFAGATMLLASERRPAFVIHRTGNPAVHAAQDAVLEALRTLAPRGEIVAVRVPVHASRVADPEFPLPPPEERENSQRSRSLLYLSLACVVAVALEVEEVYVCENGILALHVPLAPSRVGSQSTRTAHPRLLSLFARLAAETLGREVKLLNPFVGQTKGELVRDTLRPYHSPETIRKTVSCWEAGRRPRPCGVCVPCLMRQLAFVYAGVGAEVYEYELLREPARYVGSAGYRNLVDLLALVRDFAVLSEQQLLWRHPALLTEETPLEVALATYRRYAREVIAALRQEFPEAMRLLGNL